MEGWIKLHRQIIESAEWTNSSSEQKAILITLLCMVNFEPTEAEWDGKVIQLKPGQMITSIREIAKRSGTSVRNVRTALATHETTQFATHETTQQGTLITICKWDIYQDKKGKTDTRSDTVCDTQSNTPLYINKVKEDKERKEVVAEKKISTTANQLLPRINANDISNHLASHWILDEIKLYYPGIEAMPKKMNIYQAEKLFHTYGQGILNKALIELEGKSGSYQNQFAALDSFAKQLQKSPSNLRRIIV